MFILKSNFVYVLLAGFLLSGCSKKATEPESPKIEKLGMLDISYSLDLLWDPMPTRQTVIWLEKSDGTFVRSLFVSTWLAYGGYSHANVCPSWNDKADWENITKEEFDAVTAATPEAGEESLFSFDFESSGLNAGSYVCNIETHIVGDYNIKYSSTIDVANKAQVLNPESIYIPSKHEIAGDYLHDVIMEYYFSDNTQAKN